MSGAKAAGTALSLTVSRARVPLVAGGAAAAGLAGGLAVLRRRRVASRRNGGLDLDGLLGAARRLGSFGEEIGQAAAAIQHATERSKS
jgi:hypothetical protein